MPRLSQWTLTLLVLASIITGCSARTSSAPEKTAPPPGNTPQESEFPDIDSFVTDLMALYDIPGAGVALVRNGEVMYVQGYGVRSTATADPVTPDTLFAIGSITKSFTALGVLQLADQGMITLDTPIITYLPGFTLADPGATQQVTVRQVLAQTSGLPGGDDAPWVSGQITTLQAAVDYAAKLTLVAAPGAVHVYSNYNYAIAGYLITQMTGQAWASYTLDNILNPLGMTGAAFDIQTMQQAPDHAVPHSLDILEGMQPSPFVSLAGIASAGAINASARGMGNYVLLQLNQGTFNGEQLISASMLSEMHTQQAVYPPQPPIGPTGFQTNGYALGWFTADFNGRQVLWHNGSIDGFYAIVMFIPSENVGVAVLSNAGLGTGSLFALAANLGLLEQLMGVEPTRDVVAALNQEAAFDPLDRQVKLEATRAYHADPAEWAPLLGEYSGTAATFEVEARDGKLYLIQPPNTGSQTLEIIPYSPTSFVTLNRFRDGLIITYTFVPGDNGLLMLIRDGVQIGYKVPS
ncbi:MAG: beta-lactamase family protein [Chloroflexi bacterium]|nr:beta-lactamase family protein [Chloroflexota bacterium]